MINYVVIGCGAAGISAIRAIRQRDPTGAIHLVYEDTAGYYSRPGLAYLVTGEVSENGLFPYKEGEWKALDITRVAQLVTHLDLVNRQVAFHQREPLRFDRLLIATGSTAMRPEMPGVDLKGVVKLDTLADAHILLKLAGRHRTAVVVGGGITALEIVEGLVARHVETHYFLRGDRYWSNVLDETESAIVESRLVKEGVILHKHTEMAEIGGHKGRVQSVCTTAGGVMKADIVAFAIGVKPRTEIAADAGIKVDRGILVDESMLTSQADIYAAGDVAQVRDPQTGKYILDSLWGLARDQGAVAGANMAGDHRVYLKPVALNVTRLAGLTTTIIGSIGQGRDVDLVGITHGDSEAWREHSQAMVAQDARQVNRLRLLVGKQSLVGALVMGDQTLSRPLEDLVGKSVDITGIRDQLLQGGSDLPGLIMSQWKTWRSGYVNPSP